MRYLKLEIGRRFHRRVLRVHAWEPNNSLAEVEDKGCHELPDSTRQNKAYMWYVVFCTDKRGDADTFLMSENFSTSVRVRRQVFESVDHSGADRTSDRAGAERA